MGLYRIVLRRSLIPCFFFFTDLKRVIYEILCHVIRGDLKHEDVLPLLSDVTVGKLLAILISKLIIIILVPLGLR